MSLRYFAFYRQHSFSATISFSLLNSSSLLTFHLIAFSISHFLREPSLPILVTNELLCDNLSAVMLTANLAFHSKTKHFELNNHYVRERVALGILVVKHILGMHQLANIFTKSLHVSSFSLRNKLGVTKPFTPNFRGTVKTETQNGSASSVGLGHNKTLDGHESL